MLSVEEDQPKKDYRGNRYLLAPSCVGLPPGLEDFTEHESEDCQQSQALNEIPAEAAKRATMPALDRDAGRFRRPG